MNIGIAIPNFGPYVKWLPRLLDNISRQSVLPAQVAIAISEGEWTQDKDYPFKVLIQSTLEKRGLPVNSNIAVRMLDTDIVTFMHGDDLMHYQRNQLLLWAMGKPDVNAVVHGFKYGKKPAKWIDKQLQHVKLKLNHIDITVDNKKYPVAHENPDVEFLNGHGTYTRRLFDTYEFDENEFYDADSTFNAMLVRNKLYISYITQPLVLYMQHPKPWK